jgi:ribosomal protein S18 acetylase RimI-like enzyme
VLTGRELLDIHVRALFTHDGRSRLLSVNEPWGGGGPAPRLFLGRAREGNLWRFRADLPAALTEELEALCADEPAGAVSEKPPRHVDEYVRLLEGHAPVRGRVEGPAFHFAEYAEPSRPLLAVTEANAEMLRGGFEEFVEELPTAQPFVALTEGGRVVSVCRSVRVTGAAHEAGVETLPDFRGRGYAKEVVAGWARLVRSLDAVPLYSTSWENNASRALAGKLRLSQYGSDFHLT